MDDHHVIRARFGQRYTDARTPSNIEVFFEFLDHFDEVPMPDGETYRMKDSIFQVRVVPRPSNNFTEWRDCMIGVNYFIGLVKDFTAREWAELKRTAMRANVYRFPS